MFEDSDRTHRVSAVSAVRRASHRYRLLRLHCQVCFVFSLSPVVTHPFVSSTPLSVSLLSTFFTFMPNCGVVRATRAVLTLPLPDSLAHRVWDVNSGEVLNTLIHHNEAVLHLRFCNGLMVTCSKDRSIAVWDMASPTDISLRRVLVGHRAAVNVVDFDDKYIVSASGDRTIKVSAVSTSLI